MNSDQNPKHKSAPVTFWGVAVLVVVCVGAAILLVPDETQVMKRLTADGKIKRLREIVAGKIGREPGDGDLIKHAAIEFGRHGWDDTATQAMQRLTANIDSTADGFAAIKEIEAKIPDGPAGTIYSGMATRALANNKPELAANIFQKIGDLSGLSEELTTDIVTSLRASSQPAEALEVLTEFKRENGGELPEVFAELFDTLALESGDIDTAFASAVEGFDKRKGKEPAAMRAAIDKLIKVGSHAGRTEELIPLCDDYLATCPVGKMTWSEIVEYRKDNPEFDDPEFRHVATEAATFCRWNNLPDNAFDYFRKLAALGSMEALEECVALHKPLLREAEMAILLDAFVPVTGKPELTLLAAQLHSKRTDYSAADDYFRQHLAAYPDDASTWSELGGMWDAASEFELALDAYRSGAAANPKDETFKTRIARTLVTMGDYEGALAEYAGMEKFDRKVLTSYLTLASNLGDNVATNDALRKWFSLPGGRRPIDYIRLARSFGALGENEKMVSTYKKGLEAFEGDRELKIELARELSRLRRHSEVMSVTNTPKLRNDPEAISLHLSSALAIKQYRSGLSFAGDNAERRLNLPISARLPLAEIYYQTGSISKSDDLYNSIPISEMPIITRATIAFRKGKFEEAETQVLRHLASNSKDHTAWSFLASIYNIQRKKPEAEAAYERALSLLAAEMKRRYTSANRNSSGSQL